MNLKPLNSAYVFVADNTQLDVLFMMYTHPPFMIGRVVYINEPMDFNHIVFTKREFTRVLGYDILLVFEKNLAAPDYSQEGDKTKILLNNMAHLFAHYRISNNPAKYKRWKLD